jgi:Tfp pilus assembly protein PilE
MIAATAAPFRCRGFSVIELGAVIAVTVVLAALAYSAQRTHAVRVQVADGVAAARQAQNRVVEAFRRQGEAPASIADLSAPLGAHVESVTVENGRIDILYGAGADAAISGRRLSLTPYETAALEVVWVCGNTIPGAGLLPLGFAGGSRQAVQIPTTIDTRWLPRTCR